ncbi:hypothetical protein [Parasutterella sp.]|uniref:hypothetical protein n=1 Tax=Parasutterella sp. TaxID=2049037 RepID=UPI003AB425CC
MPKDYPYGEVVFSDDGETLLYGWLDIEEVIKSLSDFFYEPIEPSDIKDIQHEYRKFVPCRNHPEGYPGLYYPCEPKSRGAIKATRVIFK